MSYDANVPKLYNKTFKAYSKRCYISDPLVILPGNFQGLPNGNSKPRSKCHVKPKSGLHMPSTDRPATNNWSTVAGKHSHRNIPKGNLSPITMANRFSPLQNLNNSAVRKNLPGSDGDTNSINIALLNAQSLRHKSEMVKEIRGEFDVDIFLFVETWLKNDDSVEIGELECGGDFKFIHVPRESRQGGGVGCLAKSELNVTKKESVITKTFEHMEIEFQNNSKVITILVIYRPEPSNQNKYTLPEFYDEFTQFLAHYQTYQNDVILAGDFNFHVNKPNDRRASLFMNILDMFDLIQHVNSPTHKEGNTLDLVITRQNSIITDCFVGDLISDHNCVLLKVRANKSHNPVKNIRVRNTRSINIAQLKIDISQHFAQKPEADPQADPVQQAQYLNKLIDLYNSSRVVLDKHAPAKTKTVMLRKPTPWTNKEIKDLKITKRKAEKQWRKSKLETDWENFKEKKNAMNTRLKQMKSEDLKTKIHKTKGDSKSMFKILNASLNRKQTPPLPHHYDDKLLANEFNTFFEEKISRIRSKLDTGITKLKPDNKRAEGEILREFKPFSLSEVKKLILKMPVKHCALDPMPTWLLRECIDEFLPLTTEIVNLSLQLGEMPLALKHALVRPLLKKPGLDPIMKNYRPVSNLPFLSKVIESAVMKQYNEHMCRNNYLDNKQSAYKKFHSTETLLTKIHNDVMLSLSKGEVTILVLLDLSAAFDTIDHNILIRRLKDRYNIHGKALEWFKSYLSQRSQAVNINNVTSAKKDLKYGVPQGSKLGPILFNSYVAPVSEVAKRNHVEDEKYADDEQLVLSFKPNCLKDQVDAVTKMEKCIADIRDFLHENMLCNNGDKTELLIIGTPHQLKKLKINSIKVDNTVIKTADNVKNLGVIFDKEMTMEKHVNKMCKSVYFNLRNVSKIRNSLDIETAKTAVNALVTPHLDYCNGLLYGINTKLLDKLQVAQNSAVRLIKKLKKRDSVTCHRKNLHWLPIPARIEFKILMNTWKALNGQSPEYIKTLLQEKEPIGSLRSNDKLLLSTQIASGKNKMEDRAFSHSAPKLWNLTPLRIRTCNSLESFKKQLKTHLFQEYYK